MNPSFLKACAQCVVYGWFFSKETSFICSYVQTIYMYQTLCLHKLSSSKKNPNNYSNKEQLKQPPPDANLVCRSTHVLVEIKPSWLLSTFFEVSSKIPIEFNKKIGGLWSSKKSLWGFIRSLHKTLFQLYMKCILTLYPPTRLWSWLRIMWHLHSAQPITVTQSPGYADAGGISGFPNKFCTLLYTRERVIAQVTCIQSFSSRLGQGHFWPLTQPPSWQWTHAKCPC